MVNFPNAKINIGLNITSRRTDGYHNLETVFYPIKIIDVLEIVESNELSFQSTGIPIPGTVEDNLCVKAYHLIRQDHQLPPVAIHLHKHIPIGAGLGGGSANAGFFIKLINQKFELNLSTEAMLNYARQLGADCAFFIENKPVYAFNKGDEFESVQLNLTKYYLALIMPPVHVSTGEAYRGVRPMKAGHSLKELIGQPVSDWKQYIKNDFEDSVFKNHPQIRGVKSALYEAGALYASMSGSGASVFGIFDHQPNLSALEKENKVYIPESM
jgi:4-diphosphocytidyl-2-C-methyl-D-erythritol kinase